MEYRCVATSVEGFVQQLAVAYITHGYWFYVLGHVPLNKDPTLVDDKLVAKYGIAISKWARARRKRQGLANIHYLRYDRTFVLIATKGSHRFFEDEAGNINDVRRRPIQFAGYSIGYRMGVDRKRHASIRIAAETYLSLKSVFEALATQRPAVWIESSLSELPFVRYAPVRRQLLSVCRAVNRERKRAGLGLVAPRDGWLHRRQVVPFGTPTQSRQRVS
ncbi:MAG: hypothetical protein A49_09460 [Methyloceanibacter sp.]|nr:MAG: hypothetical protein A49_09460 [Methyloceanibacter sp.]